MQVNRKSTQKGAILSFMSRGQRLNQVMATLFQNKVAALAKAIDFPRGGLYKYLKGEQEPGWTFAMRLEPIGVDPTWFMTGTGEMYANNEAGRALKQKAEKLLPGQMRYRASPKPKKVPLMMESVPAGPMMPLEHDDVVEKWFTFDDLLVGKHRDHTMVVKVVGDSMSGAGITDGDLAIGYKTDEQPYPGEIVIAMVNGAVTIKRYDVVDGMVMLLPHNHDHKPIVLHKGLDFQILAVVRHVIHTLPTPKKRRS